MLNVIDMKFAEAETALCLLVLCMCMRSGAHGVGSKVTYNQDGGKEISEMDARLVDLEQQFKQLFNLNEALVSQISAQNQVIAELKRSVSHLTISNNNLGQAVNRLKAGCANSSFPGRQKRRVWNGKSVSYSKASIHATAPSKGNNSHSSRVSNSINRRQALQSPDTDFPTVRPGIPVPKTVAFTAIFAASEISNLQPHQTILFDTILTNTGNGYNAHSGIFTAQETGNYVFNMALRSGPGKHETLELTRNGQVVSPCYASSLQAKHSTSCSRTVVLALNKADRVWVRTRDRLSSGVLFGYGFTTFSGWKL